jgi:hypothetical protein
MKKSEEIKPHVLVRADDGQYAGHQQAQEVLSQSSFYSANDLRLHFGLGRADRADLDIRWPNGNRERIAGVSPDQVITVREGEGIVRSRRGTAPVR